MEKKHKNLEKINLEPIQVDAFCCHGLDIEELKIVEEIKIQAFKNGYNVCLKKMKIKNEFGQKSL